MRISPTLIIFSLIGLLSFSINSYAFTNAEGSINLPEGETASNDLSLEVTVYRIGEPIPGINPFGSFEQFPQKTVIKSGDNSVDFSVPFEIILGVGFTYGVTVSCSSCETYYPGLYSLQADGSTNVTQPDGSTNIFSSSNLPKLESGLLLNPINFVLVRQTDDIDEDSILNNEDNCILSVNTDQVDTNDNGVGDSCDVDDDGDTILDAEDNCPLNMNTDQTDSDDNGIGDACQIEAVDEELCFPIKGSTDKVGIICL